MRRLVLLVLTCAFSLAVARVNAQTPTDDRTVWTLRTSFKTSALLSQSPDDPALFPDRDSATGFWRLRLDPSIRLNSRTHVEMAFEQRVRAVSSSSGLAGAGILPVEAVAPFRIRQLDGRFAASNRVEWRGEIDRAAIRAELGATTVTVGRQAIGWGRGVLFGAVDLFSPFAPLEADREWRRGVDGVRADIRLADRTSLDLVSAFGPDIDRSAFAARLRGYAGKADLELVGGRRARDVFGGITSSAAVAAAEVHGELAVFRAPAAAGSSTFASERSIVKAVTGASYRFPLGNGLLVFAEYHYSGFGAASAAAILPLLADPAFQERYLRGDTQILGRHALALLASYEHSPELSFGGQWLQSPVDGSGVAVGTATWTLSDNWSVVAGGYVPFGREAVGLALRSQFGSSPLAALIQIRGYR